jgi:hypothetical protein
MANADFSLLLEDMKAMRSDLRDFRRAFDLPDADMRTVKGHQATFMQSEIVRDAQYADLLARLERVETRLELRDTTDGN